MTMQIKLFINILSHFFQSIKAMVERNFIFGSVQLLYYKYHKVNFRPGGSNINSPYWIRKATINPKNKDDKCF